MQINLRKCVLLLLMLLFAFSACTSLQRDVNEAFLPKAIMQPYTQMIQGDAINDLRLTIYYMDPSIFTMLAVTPERLMTDTKVKKIVVESAELTQYRELLGSLNASVLKPVKEELGYMDARIYYVFETKSGEKILEVVSCGYTEYKDGYFSNMFVNGLEVEHNHIFYKIITPFLSEEDREILGFPKT